MDSEALEPMAKLLYALLSGLSDEEGKCFPSDKYLCSRVKCSLRQIQDLLKQLGLLGLISRQTTPCPFNPFKKVRIITVSTEFKKSLRSARPCISQTAQLCSLDGHTRASIESEANIESEDICRRKSQTTPTTPLASPSAQLVAAAAPTSCAFSSQEEGLSEKRKPKTQPAPLQTHPEAIRLAQKLLAKILAIHPKFKPPKLPKWSAEVERMHRLDGRTFEEIEEMIDYAFDKDPFWVDKLQCAKKLRLHFDKIWLKAHPPENEGTNIEKNRKSANQVKAYLSQFNEDRFLTIHKSSVSRQYPYDSASFSLPPETFQSILANWFNLERGG